MKMLRFMPAAALFGSFLLIAITSTESSLIFKLLPPPVDDNSMCIWFTWSWYPWFPWNRKLTTLPPPVTVREMAATSPKTVTTVSSTELSSATTQTEMTDEIEIGNTEMVDETDSNNNFETTTLGNEAETNSDSEILEA